MGNPLVSLCMIVKNEAQDLPRCLMSAKKIAGELIVVDTGSTDDTVKIAREMGARVYDFTWTNNFSDARNYSLDQASGDWILWLDADEELSPDTAPDLLPLLNNPGVEGIRINMINFIGSQTGGGKEKYLFLKIFRNKKDYRFVRSIHEQLLGVPDDKIINCPKVLCYHYGYLDSARQKKQKGKRNLEILEQEIQGETDNFSWFNIGLEYLRENRFQEAVDCLGKCLINLPPDLVWAPKVHKALATGYIQLGLFEKAVEVCRYGLSIYPSYPDLCYLQALAYKEMGMFPLAIGLFHQCASMTPEICYMNEESYQGYRVWLALAQSYGALGKFDPACKCYLEAYRNEPGNTSLLTEMVSALADKISLGELTGKMEKALEDRGKGTPLLVANILTMARLYEQALEYLNTVPANNPENEAMYAYLKGICLIMLGRWTEACEITCDMVDPKLVSLKNFLKWSKHDNFLPGADNDEPGLSSDEYLELALLFWLKSLCMVKQGIGIFGGDSLHDLEQSLNQGVAVFEK